MHDLIDLQTYPLDHPHSPAWQALVADCRARLAAEGLFNLPGFLHADRVASLCKTLTPLLERHAFVHARSHNIYFAKSIPDLPENHPALRRFETSNQTICADQMQHTALMHLYEWPPFATFLAAVMEKEELFTMADPLASVNVMRYTAGQALNWHFDRAAFTTTLLLQAPTAGGVFEYAKDLRSAEDPNYDGVADLLEGRLAPMHMPLTAGTLNVFKGKNTAHRVTPVSGERARIIAVFSYFDRPGVMFSRDERIGFYGRAD